ncbi:SDR family oxidoreductase [Microbulbifer salipaludis]|uniref:SDR family oxidoreductase n=1 Tax=Microbulbifer salipaludis TaxID=187980 RepID=A0ABS3E7L8_9GAMM|nr:SDR family oxidoreductase [Microbulbifer salipaludis]MBN8431303.1 SDR family oxidoreductase [Microbulbifer salipaludis]
MNLANGVPEGQLTGKTALVTAGASGIGRCIAETLLAAGVRVFVCDVDRAAVVRFLGDNPAASGAVVDVADAVAVEGMFRQIEREFGCLDILVNNAGIAGPTALVEDIETEAWDRTVAVDLNGQFYCTKYAVPMMKRAGSGAIVNISSNAAMFGFPYRSPYTASKWALIGLTKTWAMELGPHNIRVNALCPGSVKGPRIDGVIEREAASRGVPAAAVRDVYERQSSMRLFVSADDIAQMVLFLASPAGAAISGQSIAIDGHTESLSCDIHVNQEEANESCMV